MQILGGYVCTTRKIRTTPHEFWFPIPSKMSTLLSAASLLHTSYQKRGRVAMLDFKSTICSYTCLLLINWEIGAYSICEVWSVSQSLLIEFQSLCTLVYVWDLTPHCSSLACGDWGELQLIVNESIIAVYWCLDITDIPISNQARCMGDVLFNSNYLISIST